MNWRKLQASRFFVIALSALPLLSSGRIIESNSCSGITSIASSYLQNTLGTGSNLLWNNKDGRDLEICRRRIGRAERSCCSIQHERVFKANAFKFISRFSPKTFSDVILTQSNKVISQVKKLLNQTQNKVRYRLSRTYRVPQAEYNSALSSLFARLSLSANFSENTASTERLFDAFFIELFPSIFVHQMGGDSGTGNFRACLKANYNKFRPRPFLNLPAEYGRQLHAVLSAYRLLLNTLRFSANLINATTSSALSPACLRGVVRLRLCHLCAGQNVSRPCKGSCLNVHRGCFAHLLPLRRSWAEFVRGARELVDAIAGRNSLIISLKQFDATILKATQKAMFNVAIYGQQVVTHCTKPGDFASSNRTDPANSGTAVVSPENMIEPEISDPDLQPRLIVLRDLLTNNEGFFGELPDQFCKGLLTRGCWNGTHQTTAGYSRTVWRFSDEEQADNSEVQRQAPDSFPDSEVERQRIELVKNTKKIVLFISARLLKPEPLQRPRPNQAGNLPDSPRQGPREVPLEEGSGSGLGPLSKNRWVQVTVPDDDDDDDDNNNNNELDLGRSGSGAVPRLGDPNHLSVNPVPSSRMPTYESQEKNNAGTSLSPTTLTVFTLSTLMIFMTLPAAI